MIRDRRTEDLDVLCAILESSSSSSSSSSGQVLVDPRAWLETDAAVRSWVYDMAPAHVTPTGNVVGHVQVYCPSETSSTPDLAASAGCSPADLLAIGRLLVKPQRHAHGIARHLLKESRTFVQRQGRTAVLDLRVNTWLTSGFCERYGFVELQPPSATAAPMVYAG